MNPTVARARVERGTLHCKFEQAHSDRSRTTALTPPSWRNGLALGIPPVELLAKKCVTSTALTAA